MGRSDSCSDLEIVSRVKVKFMNRPARGENEQFAVVAKSWIDGVFLRGLGNSEASPPLVTRNLKDGSHHFRELRDLFVIVKQGDSEWLLEAEI